MPITLTRNDPKNSIAELHRHVGRPTFGLLWDAERQTILNSTTVTIPAGVQRAAIGQEAVRAFAKRVVPLRLFASTFSNVPLQGLDTIEVQYFPLQSGASSDWNPAAGYVFDKTVTQQVKEITVNKRKYQPMDWLSEVATRQPFFNAARLAEMNGEKLAVDVLSDVLSVVTASNYGDTATDKITVSAEAITSDDITDLAGLCNDAHWPDAGRGLIVDSSVNTNLMKDDSYKLAVNIMGAEVLREGRLPNISGFQYAWMPSLPANSENLIGFACHQSAMAVAFCPVAPTAEVRQVLSSYEIATDPATGISINFRAWGNPQADRSFQVIETAYGYQVIHAAALKRIVAP